jgi:hypothetical protein
MVMPAPRSAPPEGPNHTSADLRSQNAPPALKVPILSRADREVGERLIARASAKWNRAASLWLASHQAPRIRELTLAVYGRQAAAGSQGGDP